MSDASDRTIPASPRRREQARRAGMEPSAALPAWAASAATAIMLAPAWSSATIQAAAEAFRDAASAAALHDGAMFPVSPGLVVPTLGLVAASAAAGMAVRLLCDGMSFQPARAAFDPQRISPLAGLRRIFSGDTVLAMLGHGLALIAFIAVAVIAARPLMATLSAPAESAAVGHAAWRVVMGLAGVASIFTVVQWLLAKRRFEGRIRMTPQEYAEDAKDLQADPRVRLMQQKRKANQPPVSGAR